MGLFSSLFGKSGSDKADKMRQAALDAFSAIQTPALKDLQVQLDKYVQAGKLTPEQAESQLLTSNAFNDIATDPSLRGAQKQALNSLQSVGSQGGLTAIDKAQLQDITNQQNQEANSRNASIMQNAQQRGMGNSDLSQVNQLINEQGAADRAAQSGTNVAAQAQARALQAMQAAGQLGGQMEAQQYGEAANKANAANAIDLFNKQTLNQTNLYNTQAANQAQAANLANAQAVSNANTQTGNENKTYNAQQNQQIYNDALQKAQGIAGVNQNAANAADANAAKDMAGNVGLTSGLLQAGGQALGGAFAGPVGAAAAPSFTGTQAKKDPNEIVSYSEGGEVMPDHPEHPEHMAMGGTMHCYAYGGDVHHHPDCYMSKGGFLSGLKKGALHEDLGVPSDRPIPSGKLEKATHSDNETLRKRAQFAENAKHWSHSEGGEIQDFKQGGHVPGRAKVAGDSPKNDTVDAKLSPGELVVPRSAANDDEEFNQFMEKFRPSKRKQPSTSGPLEVQALTNLHKRVSNLEGK